MASASTPYRGESVANPCRPVVIRDWTDYNDHFNVAYYVLAFDMAADGLREADGFAPADLAGAGASFKVLRSRVSYLREVHLGRALTMTTQVLHADRDVLHLLQAMHVDEDGYLAAIEERVEIGTSVPAALAEALAARAARHAGLPVPDGWGDLARE